jgi:hypothetical protein
MTTIIATYPAYDIVEAPATKAFWKDRDVFALPVAARFGIHKGEVLWHFFTLGSVVSYALTNGEDPIAATERAIGNRHQLHWANQNAVCIHDGPHTKKTVIGLNWDDVIRFEGHLFSLAHDHNDNVRLVEAS